MGEKRVLAAERHSNRRRFGRGVGGRLRWWRPGREPTPRLGAPRCLVHGPEVQDLLGTKPQAFELRLGLEGPQRREPASPGRHPGPGRWPGRTRFATMYNQDRSCKTFLLSQKNLC